MVKASGYMSLKDVVDVLLLRPCPKWSAASLRYIQRGYWRLMLTCYFATDTDNTKVQVRDGSNRMWPLTDEAAADGGGGGGDLLMRRYLENAAPGGAGSRAATEESCSSLIQVRSKCVAYKLSLSRLELWSGAQDRAVLLAQSLVR